MRLYHLLSRVFPASFSAKLAFLVFAGMQMPAVLTLLALGAGPATGRTVMLVFGVHLAAMAITVTAIRWVLMPIFRVNATVAAYAETRAVRLLPDGYGDEVGRLMANVNALMLDIDAELDAASREAETDPLTGLLNRRGFERLMPPIAMGSVLYIDIDHFKQINDQWGHATGDAALVSVSDAISGALRSRDVLARMGGEEFAVYIEETVESRALDVAERIQDRVRADVRVHGRPVTVSVGLAIADMPAARDALCAAADAATYAAKLAGRDRVVLSETPLAAA